MFFNKIPPIKAVDYKENFIQNFFDRLLDMKIIRESESLKIFIDDYKFSNIKAKEIKNINSVMKQKMQKLHENPQLGSFFKKNEEVYNRLLKDIFSDYEKQKENSSYFSAIFKHLDNYSIENSKSFSKLKHLSYQLSDLLGKTAEIVHRIAGVFNKFVIDSNSLYKKINFNRNEEVELIHKKLKVGIYEWGSQLLTQKKFVIDNLASFFHFKKHEYKTFSELLNLKMTLSAESEKSMEELNAKKLKLFQSKDIKKWQINQNQIGNININEMFQNFDMVKDYMIPDESATFYKERDLNKFLNKHLLFEFLNFYTNSQFYFETNFSEFTDKMMKSFQKDDLLWNIFTHANVDVSFLDRKSAYTLTSLV
jgi:hypothetical protein